MTPSQLKALHLENTPDSHYFDRKKMAYHGDTMSNYRVRKERVLDRWDNEFWAFVLYRKRPVIDNNNSVNNSVSYFSIKTGKLLHDIQKEVI